MEIMFKRPDSTFVIAGEKGPYHVVQGDPIYDEVASVAAAMGDELEFEPAPVAPPPTLDDFRFAIQWHIDSTAQQRSYDSGITCSSYLGSTNPAWAAEASVFVAWRDAVWVYAYAELAKVEGGQREVPTIEGLLAELPSVEWP